MSQQRTAAPPPAQSPPSPARQGAPPPATLTYQPPATSAADANAPAIVSGRQVGAQRVVLYGPGGIGKSSLAALAPKPLFFDVERGTRALEVDRLDAIETFAALRAALQSTISDAYQSIVIDSATKSEELAVAHTIATVPHEKGHRVTSIEGYGFGKGYSHVYDTYLLLLQDLDALVRRGKHVILIAHDCIADVPNPAGDNWIRWEPRLQHPKKEASIRNRVCEWADHVLFLGYDVVTVEGKGRGAGTRTIYPQEMPTHRAKSRVAVDPTPFVKGDGSIWQTVLGGGA